MGTVSFSVGEYGRSRGTGAATLMATKLSTSGAFTTSTGAANIEDAGGDIQLSTGSIFRAYADVAMRIRFGGGAATATVGHYIPAGSPADFEVADSGTVSIIDVA